MPEENKYKALDSLTPTNKQTQAHDSVHILVEIIIIFLKFRGTLTIETTQRLENFKHFEVNQLTPTTNSRHVTEMKKQAS